MGKLKFTYFKISFIESKKYFKIIFQGIFGFLMNLVYILYSHNLFLEINFSDLMINFDKI